MTLTGHVRTVGNLLVRGVRTVEPPPSVFWKTSLEDPVAGTVPLSGRLAVPTDADTLLILVHGLGGSSERGYMCEMAQTAWSLGVASLRLNLRGADRKGSDFYHGGLTDDLHAAIADEDLAGFEHVVCLGFSLGGHMVLRFGTEARDARVRAVAGICAPLDLGAGAWAIDGAALGVYRFYLLRGLKAMYRGLVASGGIRPDESQTRCALAARTLRDWDAATVVPRFGFRDVDDYYERASVGPRIHELRVPGLLLAVPGDPMVPAAAIRAFADPARPTHLTLRWTESGGHLALPRRVDLGMAGSTRWRVQVLRWLLAAANSPGDRLARGER